MSEANDQAGGAGTGPTGGAGSGPGRPAAMCDDQDQANDGNSPLRPAVTR
jgi:hypothetical protein